MPMLIGERHTYIKKTLEKEGKVLITELSQHLNVSIDTIRRDLQKLALLGVLRRTHGGALTSMPLDSYVHREKSALDAKNKLAAATVGLLSDGQVVFLDAGTTNLHVAQQLPADLKITIITNNIPAAMVLMDHAYIEVILTGGPVVKHCRMTSGLASLAIVKKTYADISILGDCSMHAEKGICVNYYEEAYNKKIMIEQAGEVIAPVLAEKLGNIYTYKVDEITSITHLVTENKAPAHKIQAFRERDINVILVDTEPHPSDSI
jgi:DeoR/GlpR family transcriptional regulator of sugar metabolism